MRILKLASTNTCLFFFFFLLGKDVSAQKPVVSSFLPTRGPIGSVVVISGNNFSPVASNNIVFFGDVKANVTAASATSLSVVVPAGAAYKPLSVTVNGLTTYSTTSFIVTFPGDGNGFTPNSFASEADSSWGFGVNYINATDLDGDGDLDPVLVNSTGNNIVLLKNNSTIGSISLFYSPPLKYTTGTASVYTSCGDLDGDG
ncbi:MAG: IPT/TIG domain-containing protein, partial [Flavisolibacter sp.]